MAEKTLDARSELVLMLCEKIANDTYPSSTMMDLVEEIVTAEERGAYIDVLWQKVRNDTYPSLDLMKRLRDQAEAASSER
jgi:hypothetical protein